MVVFTVVVAVVVGAGVVTVLTLLLQLLLLPLLLLLMSLLFHSLCDVNYNYLFRRNRFYLYFVAKLNRLFLVAMEKLSARTNV